MIGTLPGPWLLAAALLLLGVAFRRSRPRRADLLTIAVLCTGAATARLAWGIWGPLHVNGQGPLWIRGALDPVPLAGYGPGYFELFSWAAIFGTAADRAVFAANAILSAISPGLLYATARWLGVGRGGALGAALVLAADPVTVRTAASEGYFASLIALMLAVQLALACGVRAHADGHKPARNLAFTAAGLIAASAARIHPMSYLPLVLCPLVVLGSARADGWPTRLRLAALAAAAIGAAVLLTSATTIVNALLSSPMTGQAFSRLARSDASWLLGLLALVPLLHRWLTPAWLPLLGVCSLAALVATQNAFQQSALWKLCYQRVYFAGILLGAAPLLPRRAQGPLWAVASAGLGTLFLFATARPHLAASTTEQLEYRFLQENLAAMPPRCTLAAVSQADMRIWEIPSYLVPQSSGQRTVSNAIDLGAAPADCLLYVRSSLCSSAEGRPVCEAVEREVPLERLASQVFPPLPSYAGLPYDRAEVEVVIFRVTQHTAGVNDGAAITPAFARQLYDRLKGIRESDQCVVGRLDTSRFRMTIGVQPPSGGEQAIEVATATSGGWMVVAPDAARRECGATITALERVLRDIGDPRRVR